jgi:molecular chaperone DnaK
MDKLNNVFQAASQDMYNASNAQGAENAGGSDQNQGGGNAEDEVTDVDFEEVKDK